MKFNSLGSFLDYSVKIGTRVKFSSLNEEFSGVLIYQDHNLHISRDDGITGSGKYRSWVLKHLNGSRNIELLYDKPKMMKAHDLMREGLVKKGDRVSRRLDGSYLGTVTKLGSRYLHVDWDDDNYGSLIINTKIIVLLVPGGERLQFEPTLSVKIDKIYTRAEDLVNGPNGCKIGVGATVETKEGRIGIVKEVGISKGILKVKFHDNSIIKKLKRTKLHIIQSEYEARVMGKFDKIAVECGNEEQWNKVQDKIGKKKRDWKYARNHGSNHSNYLDIEYGEFSSRHYWINKGYKIISAEEYLGEDMKLDNLTDTQQEELCSMCVDILEVDRNRCEGSRCEQVFEMYLEENNKLNIKKEESTMAVSNEVREVFGDDKGSDLMLVDKHFTDESLGEFMRMKLIRDNHDEILTEAKDREEKRLAELKK